MLKIDLQSSDKNSLWLGPAMTEGISGLKLTGEASLLPFLTSVNFEESVGRIFKAFSGPCKNGQLCEESVRQHSVTSSDISQMKNEPFEEPPNALFVSSILDFLVQIIKLDTVRFGTRFV